MKLGIESLIGGLVALIVVSTAFVAFGHPNLAWGVSALGTTLWMTLHVFSIVLKERVK